MPVPQKRSLAPTSAADWRKGYLLQLPSGRAAMVRPISVMALLTSKSLPNEMLRVVEEWIDGPKIGADTEELANKLGGKVYAVRTSRQFYEAYAFAALISPRVVFDPDPEKDEISPLDLDDQDLQFLQSFMGRPGSELARFSAFQQTADVEHLFGVQAFFDPPQPASDDQPVAAGEPVESVRG